MVSIYHSVETTAASLSFRLQGGDHEYFRALSSFRGLVTINFFFKAIVLLK